MKLFQPVWTDENVSKKLTYVIAILAVAK